MTNKRTPSEGPGWLQRGGRLCLAAVLPLAGFLHQVAASAPPADRPNILVILTDDQGWGDIGYNNPRVYTPNLDRLAAGGAKLTQHYVTPQCTPTRIALFTGRYPGRFGVTGLQATNRPVLPHGVLTLATMLKRAGYQTHLTGKWHLGSLPEHGPNHHGFDHAYGALAGAVGAYSHTYRAAQQNNPYSVTWHRDGQIIPGHENGRHVTDLVTDEAVRVIRRRRDKPFFLYLPYFAPHTPLDERGRFVNRPTQLDGDNPSRWLNEDRIEWFNDPAGLIQQEKDPEKRLLLAVLHHLDHAIGRVIAALDESGQRNKTVVFFSSDNGPQVNWNGGAYPDDLRLTDFNQPTPFRGAKLDVYEGGVRVPAFVSWPDRVRPREINTPLHIVDWLPTIAALTGADATPPADQPGLDGGDFSPLLLGDASLAGTDRVFYFTHHPQTNKWALRHGDWKLVHYGRDEPTPNSWRLYNLRSDPAEATNLAGGRPETVARLHERFLAERSRDRPGPNFPGFDEAARFANPGR